MSLLNTRPGFVLASGGGRRLLWRPIPVTADVAGAGSLTALPGGALGYWDASTLLGMLDANGTQVTGWGLNVTAVKDQTGTQSLAAFSVGGSLPQSTPRLNGTLGGLGLSTITPPTMPRDGQYLPVMGPDQGFQLAGQDFAASSAWTWYLVWSRPNWRQGGSSSPVAMLSIGGTPVITLSHGTVTSDTLVLMPGAANVLLSSSVTRRHTRALIITNTPGVGLSVWLDGLKVAGNVPCAASGVVTILHDATVGGGAQCWFHEAAAWRSALSDAAVAQLASYSAGRWKLGARRGVSIVVNGQSNASRAFGNGAWHLTAQGLAWYIGALAGNVIAADYQTLIGGAGLYVDATQSAAGFSGSFLNYATGADPGTWSLGPNGIAAQSYVAGRPTADLADVVAIMWPWSETDSLKAYSAKAEYHSAQKRYLALMRGWVGKPAAQCPLVAWNAMPFPWGNNGDGTTPNDGGVQMVRESHYDLTLENGQNAWIAPLNTADILPNGATPAADGTWTGGDNSHMSPTDNVRLGIRAAAGMASAVLTSTGGDALSAIPGGVTKAGGPTITRVYRQTATQYVLTVAHDGGTDLIVQGRAASGLGFALMDGGSQASPGPIIPAVSCVRQDATHLLITLRSAPTNSASSCRFFYPYGNTQIGRGSSGNTVQGSTNAVTDNASTITPPDGWDIVAHLGTQWGINYPLAATTYGLNIQTVP